MEKSILILSTFVLLFHLRTIDALFSSWKNPNRCGNMTISTVEDYKKYQRPILRHLWRNSLSCCDNSPLAESFKEQVWSLLDSRDDEVFGYAEKCVIVLAILSPHMEDNPITCYTAQLIDASIPCMTDKECSAVIGSLTSSPDDNDSLAIGDFYSYLLSYIYYNALGRVDDCMCDEDEIYSQYPNVKCEQRGLVYKIDEAWNLRGGFLPEEFKCTVKRLYDSCDDRDRFIANMATYRLLEFSNLFKNGYDPKLDYEYLYLQYAPMNKHCCCDGRKKRLRFLKDALDGDGKNNVHYLTSFHENRV